MKHDWSRPQDREYEFKVRTGDNKAQRERLYICRKCNKRIDEREIKLNRSLLDKEDCK